MTVTKIDTNTVYKNYSAFKDLKLSRSRSRTRNKMPVIQKREYGKNGTIYYQYRLNIPQKIIDLLRWNGNDKVDYTIHDGKLVVSKTSL